MDKDSDDEEELSAFVLWVLYVFFIIAVIGGAMYSTPLGYLIRAIFGWW